MLVLVIKEDMWGKGFQDLVFGDTPEEKGFVDANIPGAQGSNYSFMSWAVAGCYQRRANRWGFLCCAIDQVEL